MNMTPSELAGTIEHTLLKPEAVPEQIDRLCDEAAEYGFHGVCVNPIYVDRAAGRLDALRGPGAPQHSVVVVSVAGFPLGSTPTRVKVIEAAWAVGEGAMEVDMVACLGAVMAGDWPAVTRDVEAVASAVHTANRSALLKVILEAAALDENRLIAACRCCRDAGADFVKTSTGFHPSGGARVEDVRLMREHAAPLRVKAAGGIRDASTALAMLAAGATRIGASAGPAIIAGLTSRG